MTQTQTQITSIEFTSGWRGGRYEATGTFFVPAKLAWCVQTNNEQAGSCALPSCEILSKDENGLTICLRKGSSFSRRVPETPEGLLRAAYLGPDGRIDA